MRQRCNGLKAAPAAFAEPCLPIRARAVRDYVQDENVGWTIGLDPKSKAALAYGTTGQPETFVIGPDGRAAREQFAAVSVDNLETMLRAARGTL